VASKTPDSEASEAYNHDGYGSATQPDFRGKRHKQFHFTSVSATDTWATAPPNVVRVAWEGDTATDGSQVTYAMQTTGRTGTITFNVGSGVSGFVHCWGFF